MVEIRIRVRDAWVPWRFPTCCNQSLWRWPQATSKPCGAAHTVGCYEWLEASEASTRRSHRTACCLQDLLSKDSVWLTRVLQWHPHRAKASRMKGLSSMLLPSTQSPDLARFPRSQNIAFFQRKFHRGSEGCRLTPQHQEPSPGLGGGLAALNSCTLGVAHVDVVWANM